MVGHIHTWRRYLVEEEVASIFAREKEGFREEGSRPATILRLVLVEEEESLQP